MGRREPQGVGERAVRAALAPVAAALLATCGYAPARVAAPEGVRRLAVEPFTVEAGPPALGPWLAEAVATELSQTAGVSLAGVDRADAVVRGVVRAVGDADLALGEGVDGPRAGLAAVDLEVHAALVGRDGRRLRAVGPLRPEALRAVSMAGQADRVREERALRAAAEAAGRAVVRALLR